MLVITPRPERARQLHEEIPYWLGGDDAVRLFPEPDSLPYERLSSAPFTVQQRLRVLAELGSGHEAPLVVAPAHAVARRTVLADRLASARHTVETGSRIDLDEMLARLLGLGYEMDSTAELPGTMSRRGGIIDVYPSDSDLPARIELFGNEVESIRLYDPQTQRSTQLVDRIMVGPAREMLAPPSGWRGLLAGLDPTALISDARAGFDEDAACLLDGRWFDGLELYASLVNEGSFLDYWPDDALVVLDQPELIEVALEELDSQAIELSQTLVAQGELPVGFPVPYLTWPELATRIGGFEHRLDLERWGEGSGSDFMGLGAAPGYDGLLPEFLRDAADMAAKGRRVAIVSQQAARLSELFAEQDVFVSPVEDVEHLPPAGSITLVRGSLAGGWRIDGEAGDILFSDAEVFGFIKKRREVSERAIAADTLLSEVSPGDFVVHVDHGIGRFAGLTRLDLEKVEREYLVLEYAADDKLYVPSDQADRVSRYVGPGGYAPSLNRLGTQEWNRAKQRVKEAAAVLARELVSLYSAREVIDGFAFASDSVWQGELEASFPYVETADQLNAVLEVKRDMETPRPMDRLVCGDVGYGKTEVAIRAAFKAVMDGTQVAVLVPTTVLAQQHLSTFTERVGAFPVNVELLSRFRSPREQQEVLQGLATGAVDVCIGTHRLVQKDVSFRNLGLLIIDEEQRFGVTHKERLKQLRREVDVLTLSATPIPRTLHMSLVGVRDMSTMETPPQERHPIRSHVGPYSDTLVREAVLRELERGGQVFYVHNRVQRINWVARKLAELLPEASIGVGHGQMPEESLESVMLDFGGGKMDVLVCTTIIESGLDLPNVNTLIVDDADRMGLTQLYQLRGRVGRGTSRAYAYFLYSRGKELTDAAQRRLRAILEASELGAGFRIAMRDLEIRGAGNLLGPEQSGHMGAVGFDLYNRLLADAVSDLKGSREPAAREGPTTTTIDLPLTAHIPEDYVPDLSARLGIYTRLAGVGSLEGLDELQAELKDRFGPWPASATNLFYLVGMKLKAGSAGIEEVSFVEGQVVIRVAAGASLGRELLQRELGEQWRIGTRQLRLDVRRGGRGWRSSLDRAIELLVGAAARPDDGGDR
jgi:transcription-repair coupling factor (superfamily II helicase)